MEKLATEILDHEHRSILKIIGVMGLLAEALKAGKQVSADTLQHLVEFMRAFAGHCHHGKEEKYLFPLLIQKGVPIHGCPMEILIKEHEEGTQLTERLEKTAQDYTKGKVGAAEELVKVFNGFMQIYPGHIFRESYLLFPMTNKILSDREQRELATHFKQVEDEMGRDIHRRFEEMAQMLEEKTRAVHAIWAKDCL